VRTPRPVRGFPSRDDLAGWLRNQLFLQPGSARDDILARELERRLVVYPDGSFGVSSQVPMETGIVWWQGVTAGADGA
jgi:hypothetical protein